MIVQWHDLLVPCLDRCEIQVDLLLSDCRHAWRSKQAQHASS